MNNLKETIENTLINNLETTAVFAGIDLESIQRCSDYIAQEIKDVAIGFAVSRIQDLIETELKRISGEHTEEQYISDLMDKIKDNTDFDEKWSQLFDQFITNRYKKE